MNDSCDGADAESRSALQLARLGLAGRLGILDSVGTSFLHSTYITLDILYAVTCY